MSEVGKTGTAKPPTAWLKSVHYQRHAGYAWHADEKFWISDPGRRDKHGIRAFRADGVPWGEPSWKVDDLVGFYFTGTLKIPVLGEVISPPVFNPDFVQKEGAGEPDAGERWPWVTWFRGIARVDLADAPTLEELDIDPSRMRQRPRLKLDGDEGHRLKYALA